MRTDRPERSTDQRSSTGWRRGRRIGPIIGLAIAVTAIAVTAPAMAQSPGLYDPGRMLKHLGNECLGVPECLTVESQPTTVAVGQHTSIALRCPRSHPHIAGWDTEQSEHLTAHVPPRKVRSAFGEPGGGQNRAPILTLLVTNHADVPGVITAFLGCAAEPTRVTAFRRHRGAVPSNHGSQTPNSLTQGGQR